MSDENQKPLSAERIAQLAGRKGVKSIAVSNFLSSLAGSSKSDAYSNLQLDTRLYKWNAATRDAIAQGIKEAKI